MIDRADKFALQFAILFLSVLLAMFLLFHVMRVYDGYPYGESWVLTKLLGEPAQQGATLDFTEAFHVNLLLVDLSLVLVIESVLFFLFIRYTVPALLVSCLGVLGVAGFGRGLARNSGIANLCFTLVRNPYARLTAWDAVLLLALNALLISFLIAMMHHYRTLEFEERLAKASGKPCPGGSSPEPSARKGSRDENMPEDPEAAPDGAGPGRKPQVLSPPPLR